MELCVWPRGWISRKATSTNRKMIQTIMSQKIHIERLDPRGYLDMQSYFWKPKFPCRCKTDKKIQNTNEKIGNQFPCQFTDEYTDRTKK